MVDVACILEIRVGQPQSPEEIIKLVEKWPEKTHPSSYIKSVVNSIEIDLQGINGNAAGYPTHVDDSINRAALVQHEDVYASLATRFPEAAETLCRGGFGENFYVNHPSLHPSEVCIGDLYEIGTAQFAVSGPRYPCPKVDAWHNTVGLASYVLQNGLSGYFLRVIRGGTCHVGDEVALLRRPHPSFSIVRVCRGLWGAEENREGQEFLEQLVSMDGLIGRHFRDTAKTRLDRIKKNNDL